MCLVFFLCSHVGKKHWKSVFNFSTVKRTFFMPVYFRLFMLFNTREPENENRIAKHKKQECEHFS